MLLPSIIQRPAVFGGHLGCNNGHTVNIDTFPSLYTACTSEHMMILLTALIVSHLLLNSLLLTCYWPRENASLTFSCILCLAIKICVSSTGVHMCCFKTSAAHLRVHCHTKVSSAVMNTCKGN